MIRTTSLVFACLSSAVLALAADIGKDPTAIVATVTVTLLTCCLFLAAIPLQKA